MSAACSSGVIGMDSKGGPTALERSSSCVCIFHSWLWRELIKAVRNEI